MWNERSGHPVLAAVVVASLAAHAAMLVALPAGASTHVAAARPPATVTFEVAAPAPPPPAPAATPVEPPAPPPVAATRPSPKRPRRVAATRPEATAPEPPPAPAATDDAPADLTGVTLTNDTGVFATSPGTGEASAGPIAAPPRAPGGSRGAAVRGGGTGTGGVVALANLSRPPRAPALDDALERNYPARARDAGIAGSAVVRARVLPDGRIGAARVLSSTGAEFGEACRLTLLGSRWHPPLDREQQPVATEISYTCRFEVSR